jgi:hypothetical protein
MIPGVMEKLARAHPQSNGDAIHSINVLLSKLKVKRRSRGVWDEGRRY